MNTEPAVIISTIMAVLGGALSLFMIFGVLTAEQGQQITASVGSIATAVVPALLTFIGGIWTRSKVNPVDPDEV